MGLVSFLVTTAILCASSASASTLANSIAIPPAPCPSLQTGNTHCKCGDSEIFFVPLIPMCYVASKCVPCEPGADICQKFRFCETCSPNIDGCETCPSDHFGKYCHLKKQSHASNGTAVPVWEIVYNHRQRRNAVLIHRILMKIEQLINGIIKSVKNLSPVDAVRAFLKPISEIIHLLVNSAYDSIITVLDRIPLVGGIIKPVVVIGKWLFDNISALIQRILNIKSDINPPHPKPPQPKPHPKPPQPKPHPKPPQPNPHPKPPHPKPHPKPPSPEPPHTEPPQPEPPHTEPPQPEPPHPKPPHPNPPRPKPDKPKHNLPEYHRLNFDDSDDPSFSRTWPMYKKKHFPEEYGSWKGDDIYRRSAQIKRDIESRNFYTYPIDDVNSDIEQFIKMFDLVMDRVRKVAMKYKGQPEKAIVRFLEPLLKIAENLMNEAYETTGKFLGKVPQDNELVGEFMNIKERFEIVKEAVYDAIKKQNTSYLHQTYSNDVYDNHFLNSDSKKSTLNVPFYKTIMKRDYHNSPDNYYGADLLYDFSLGDGLRDIFSKIREFFQSEVKAALALIKEPFKALAQILHPVAKLFLGVIRKIIDGATSLIEKIPLLGKILTPLIDAFKRAAHSVINWIDNLFNQKSALRYLLAEGGPAEAYKEGESRSGGEAVGAKGGKTSPAKMPNFNVDPKFAEKIAEFLKKIEREIYNFQKQLLKSSHDPLKQLTVILERLKPSIRTFLYEIDGMKELLSEIVGNIANHIDVVLNWIKHVIEAVARNSLSVKKRSVHFDAPSPLIKMARHLMDKILKSATLLSYDPDRASAAFFIPLKIILERCIQVFKNQEKKFITDVEGEKQWKNLIDMAINQVIIKSQKELNHDHVDAHTFFPKPVQNPLQIQKGYMVPNKMNPYSQLNRNEDGTLPSHIFEYMMTRDENPMNKQYYYNVYNGEPVFKRMET